MPGELRSVLGTNLITSKVFYMMNLNLYGLKSKKKRENFLCGCFYRDPNTDVSSFMDYLESTFTKVNQQKYLDDFNIDLLQYESHSYTNDFLNTMIFQLLFRETHKSICNDKRPVDVWRVVLDVSFVTNKHQFLSTQNFQ